MTEEEYFRKNYPDSCYGDKPLSPHWDFFQDGVEFGERQSEKRIEELLALLKAERKRQEQCDDIHLRKIADLEKEITELKAVERMALYSKMSDLLAKAKELLERLLITSCNSDVLNQYPNCSEVLKVRCEAEQFLKEVSE